MHKKSKLSSFRMYFEKRKLIFEIIVNKKFLLKANVSRKIYKVDGNMVKYGWFLKYTNNILIKQLLLTLSECSLIV